MAVSSDPYAQRKAFFDVARRRGLDTLNRQNEQDQEALQRRFTSLGIGQSGAGIKAQEQLQEQSGQQRGNFLEGIGAQEAQTEAGIQQQEQQQQYASNEALLQRNFQKELADKDLAFKDKVFTAENAARWRQLDLAARAQSLDEQIAEFNKETTRGAASRRGSILGGALNGAVSGAVFGSVVPGVGTVAGAIGGGVLGGLGSLF